MKIVFDKLPSNFEEVKKTKYSSLEKPEYVIGLYLIALKVYEKNIEEALKILEYIRGPREITNIDKQFLNDRMYDKKEYLANSYFLGSKVENNYTPDIPYVVEISENKYSYTNEGYAKLYISSSGSDSPRPITLRYKNSINKWFLWEGSSILLGIRKPINQDEWA